MGEIDGRLRLQLARESTLRHRARRVQLHVAAPGCSAGGGGAGGQRRIAAE